MAPTLSVLSRALAASWPAAVPRSFGLARPTLGLPAALCVAGVRLYGFSPADMARRRRTMRLMNVPWEMTNDDVEAKIDRMGGFKSIEPMPEKRG